MASTDFERILVKDDRIGCITDQIKYGVLKGGQNITSQTFNAISKSTSAHVFNIAVPSLETIISGSVELRIYIEARMLWQLERRRNGAPRAGKRNRVCKSLCGQLRRHGRVGPFSITPNDQHHDDYHQQQLR